MCLILHLSGSNLSAINSPGDIIKNQEHKKSLNFSKYTYSNSFLLPRVSLGC